MLISNKIHYFRNFDLQSYRLHNVLSIEFKDALDNLTIHITDENGNIIYENILSGAMGDIIDIPIDGMQTGAYQVILSHKLGWLTGEFEIR